MVLAYYLSLGQPLDVVVNVDGFNEILSDAGLLNSGMDIGYPDASLWMELVRFLEGEAQHAHTAEDYLANYHSIMRRPVGAQRGRLPICYVLQLRKIASVLASNEFDHPPIAGAGNSSVSVLFPDQSRRYQH